MALSAIYFEYVTYTCAMKLDRFDHTILSVLQADGRISNVDLADRAKLSESACLRRVRALEASGLIKGYVAQVDQAKAQQAYTQATTAPIGQQITWNNPNSGNSGTVTPTRDGTSNTGQYCREFQQTVVIGGREEQAFGTACRKPDGSWEVQ